MALENKLFKGQTLAILSGGGDTPAINSSIESVRNRAALLGYKVYGVRQGWKGLLGDGDILDLTNQPYNGLYGGTALRSSRTNPFSTNEKEDRVGQIMKNLKRYKIDVLVTIGGDDTNGAAKKLYEQEGVPVIGFPKTIDNDLRTKTIHKYEGKEIEAVICPGFPSAARTITRLVSMIKTTTESHSRVMVVEVMGRDAGWLTGTAAYGGADMVLVPEHEITMERKDFFFERVKEMYMRSPKRNLIVAVSEGIRWYNEKSGKSEMVYASSEKDEYGHARFGGVSGVIAGEISHRLGLDARAQITGYFARSGECRAYDRRLTSTLADKVADLLLRKAYGRMPVLNTVVNYDELEEYNTACIDMGTIGNQPLPQDYYNTNDFTMTPAYKDFLGHVMEPMNFMKFNYNFPVVVPPEK
ncbi:MAG: 6-phosphofructokinase [Bacteroidales bacterium]